jgi:hypothetical protein
MVLKIGVIADVHKVGKNAQRAIHSLKERGPDLLIGLGDLGDSLEAIDRTISTLGESGIESLFCFGNHETTMSLGDAEELSAEHDNLHFVDTPQRFTFNGQDILIMPGGYTLMENSGFVQDPRMFPESGYHSKNADELFNDDPIKRAQYRWHVQDMVGSDPFDLENLVRDPYKTVVFNHEPCRFFTEDAIDFTTFTVTDKGIIGGHPDQEQLKEQGARVIERNRKNVGNLILNKIYGDVDVKKVISAHIHGTGHKAHRWKPVEIEGKPVEQMVAEAVPSDELFHNCGSSSDGKCALYTLDGSLITYENVVFDPLKSVFPKVRELVLSEYNN